MKLPESFKFKHRDHDIVFEGDFFNDRKHFTVTWRENGSDVVDYEFSPEDAEEYVANGFWIIQEEK